MTRVTERYAQGTPSWVDLGTPDVPGAKVFYGGLFGWDFADQGEEYGGYVMCLCDGAAAAGLGPQDDRSLPVYWTTYLACNDVEAAAAAVPDLGGQVVFGPLEVPGTGRLAVVVDPTGGAVGLWQDTGHIGAGIVDEPGTLTWSELVTRDPAAARAFFSQLLDVGHRPLEGPPGFDYTTLRVGGRDVAGIMAMDSSWPDDASPHWTVYFAADDADAGAGRVRDLGGDVLGGPTDTPYGRMVVCRDPEGAGFRLRQPPPAP